MLCDRLNSLKMLQRECVRIEMEFHRQFYALDMKYHGRRQEIYERRKAIVNGTDDGAPGKTMADDIPEDIANGVTKALEKLQIDKQLIESGEMIGDGKGVPNFWLQAIRNCTYNDEFVQDGDNEVLKYLRDIRVELAMEPELSFTLHFEFGPNPFFDNQILTKQYFLNDSTDDDFGYGFSIIKCIGCQIDWKDGMNLLEKDRESFFKFFNPPELKTDTDATEGGMEIDSVVFFELQQDFETGLFIKEKLIPNATHYYLNEIDEVGEFGGADGEPDGETAPNDETVISQTNF